MNIFTPSTNDQLHDLLTRGADARIAVIGDFCLDVYWEIAPERAERSLETGLETRPVRSQRYSLGGAGNVVNNLAALGCRQVSVFGVIGHDPWGREVQRLLDLAGVDLRGLLAVADDTWSTLAYIKPMTDGMEAARIDFGNLNHLPDAVSRQLLAALASALPDLDLVIVNQQVREGLHTPYFQQHLADLIHAHRERPFLVDCRHVSQSYMPSGAHLKINEHEARRLAGAEAADYVGRADALQAAADLHAITGQPVYLTRGQYGLIVQTAQGCTEIPGIQVTGSVDSVGAGDSLLAGLAIALAADAAPATAADLGNLVAAVTVQKLHQTGTATPQEVLQIADAQAYIHHPELADDPRHARHVGESEIEVIAEWPGQLRLRHALFDHDGTISVLRQGWEAVMEPMMVRAILGPRFDQADEALYQQVVARVRAFIDRTTGIQTLVQMQGLAKLVRECGCVPEAEIRDAAGYKAIYNTALMEVVELRLAKLQRGELEVSDLTIRGAVSFLHALHAAGVQLYLASGTDQADVVAEATALGYAHLFQGRIHGATGDASVEAKRVVLDRLLNEIGPDGSGAVIAFGDGPVEIRETRRRGGIGIGIASDEVRRYGLSPAKRSRLIRAGAHLIVPDFSQPAPLLNLLGID